MKTKPFKIARSKRFFEFLSEVAKEIRTTYGMIDNLDVIYDLNPIFVIDDLIYVPEKYQAEFRAILERKKGKKYAENFIKDCMENDGN